MQVQTHNVHLQSDYCSYQMDIWYEVTQYSCGYSKCPYSVCHDVKNTQVEVFPDPT